MSLFKKIKKITGNEECFGLGDDNPYEIKEHINSGCYILNAVLSDGDINKGMAMGKRYMISGPSGTAKSLFTMFLIKSFLDKKKNSIAVVFETEGSSVIEMAKHVGIGKDQMIILPVSTIEDLRTQSVNILDEIIEAKKEEKDIEDIIMVVDSIGLISTRKETMDSASGSEKKDMTRTQLLRGFSRVTSLKFSLAGVPFIMVNHTYTDMMSYGAPQKVAGGGINYMADVSIILGKGKIKDEKDKRKLTGVKIKVKVDKSRYMQEGINVEVVLDFKKGMDKYSNFHDIAKKHEIIKKDGMSYILPNGDKVRMKDVKENFSKYCDDEMLTLIRNKIKEIFSFGGCNDDQ